MRQEAVAEAEQRRLDAVAQLVARGDAFLLAGVAPAFQRAVGRRRVRQAEAAGMDQQPQRGEIGESIAFEDATQVGFDIGRAGQAGIVAHQAQTDRRCAETPERALAGVQPILQGGGCGAAAAVRGQVRARPVEIVRGRDHHDRDAPAETLQRDCELPVSNVARAQCGECRRSRTRRAATLRQSHRRGVDGVSLAVNSLNMRLADAEVARDLVAQREALGNVVVGIALSRPPDAAAMRASMAGAISAPSTVMASKASAGRAIGASARHGQCPAGTST